MIYKFRQEEQDCILEIEPVLDEVSIDMVELTIITVNGNWSVCLYKDDLYKLIGALHVIHKEMK